MASRPPMEGGYASVGHFHLLIPGPPLPRPPMEGGLGISKCREPISWRLPGIMSHRNLSIIAHGGTCNQNQADSNLVIAARASWRYITSMVIPLITTIVISGTSVPSRINSWPTLLRILRLSLIPLSGSYTTVPIAALYAPSLSSPACSSAHCSAL